MNFSVCQLVIKIAKLKKLLLRAKSVRYYFRWMLRRVMGNLPATFMCYHVSQFTASHCRMSTQIAEVHTRGIGGAASIRRRTCHRIAPPWNDWRATFALAGSAWPRANPRPRLRMNSQPAYVHRDQTATLYRITKYFVPCRKHNTKVAHVVTFRLVLSSNAFS